MNLKNKQKKTLENKQKQKTQSIKIRETKLKKTVTVTVTAFTALKMEQKKFETKIHDRQCCEPDRLQGRENCVTVLK